MNDRDCESCKKFSRVDSYESEGYCEAKCEWVDPQEGEDCKIHEFTLCSATKYKDGTPIMSEPERVVTGCYICKHSMWDSERCFCKLNGAHPLAPSIGCVRQEVGQKPDIDSPYPEQPLKPSNQLDSLEQRVDELTEEYDTVLKTHGDTLEQHKERIEDVYKELEFLKEDVANNDGDIDCFSADVEDLQRKVAAIWQYIRSSAPDVFSKILEELKRIENTHNGSNFCGNCAHVNSIDGIYACESTGEIVDPDDSSCSMFEPPF